MQACFKLCLRVLISVKSLISRQGVITDLLLHANIILRCLQYEILVNMVNLTLHSNLGNLVQIFPHQIFTEDTTSSMIKCGKALFSCALRLSELVPITLKKKDYKKD